MNRIDHLDQADVIPVLVIHDDAEQEALVEPLIDSGLKVIEVTLRTEFAWKALASLARRSDVVVGAGTVLSGEQARRACDMGAEFLVSPGIDRAVIEAASSLGVLAIPGVCTPTEVMRARGYGPRLLKFFPAEASGGRAWLAAMHPVFPDIRFIPTGGVDSENASLYLALPNVAAVGGSWMTSSGNVMTGMREGGHGGR